MIITINPYRLVASGGGGTISDNTALDAKIVSHWKFDGNGNDAKASNNMTVTGASYTSAFLNDGIDCDGINDKAEAAVSGQSTTFVSMWARYNSNPPNKDTLLQCGGVAGSKVWLRVQYTTSGSQLKFQYGPIVGSFTTINTGFNPLASTDYHFVFVIEDSGVVELWVNGVKEFNSTISGTPDPTNGTIALAYDPANTSDYSDVLIDEVTLGNAVPTPTEVAFLYNSGTPLPYN